jgi:signal transduction histidine kinase
MQVMEEDDPLQALSEDKKITISTARVTEKAERLSVCGNKVKPGDYLVITVKDTGPGIDGKIRDRVFDPFITTKKGNRNKRGAGLGLSIVYKIMRDHNGYIDIESENGKGSAFSLGFPLEQECGGRG